jgi:two-component system sensor histidine kinase HydH
MADSAASWKHGLRKGGLLNDTPLSRKSPLSKLGSVALAVVPAGLIGFLEYATGYNFHLTAFFLVPICWAGWVEGRRTGLVLAVVCTVIELFADLLTGHPYKHPLIPYWNALMLLAFFVVIVYSLSAFQAAHGKLLLAQRQLQLHNEDLEKVVHQRNESLQAEMAARRRLENANLRAGRLAMVGTIAAQVAHEVRNPLGSITLNLDLISKEIEKLGAAGSHPAQEGRTLVNEIREEVQRIRHVIEDYLKFARLPKLQRKPLKVNEFLEQKLAFMEIRFEQARVRLRTDFDPRVDVINADPEQLWQALLNLLRNSIEAMQSGGTLAVSTQKSGNQVLLRVADNGRGMNEQQLAQIFVPFYTTKPRGTGLGLPLTQQILNEHGAQIECASTLGAGTAFTIHFPPEERT